MRINDGTLKDIPGSFSCQESVGNRRYFKLESLWQSCSPGSLYALSPMSDTHSGEIPLQAKHLGNRARLTPKATSPFPVVSFLFSITRKTKHSCELRERMDTHRLSLLCYVQA